MWLPELLIVLALLIAGFGLRRAFQNPAPRSASLKTALTLAVWLALLVGGFLTWNSSRRPGVRPVALNVSHQSVPVLS